MQEYPIHIDIDTISMELSILYFKGSTVKHSIKLCSPVPEYCFMLADCADPSEMPTSAVFHLDLHC